MSRWGRRMDGWMDGCVGGRWWMGGWVERQQDYLQVGVENVTVPAVVVVVVVAFCLVLTVVAAVACNVCMWISYPSYCCLLIYYHHELN